MRPQRVGGPFRPLSRCDTNAVEVYTELLPSLLPNDSLPHKPMGGSLIRTTVRTGLVVVGSVIAILGGGLIVTLFFLSAGPATTSLVSVQNGGLLPGTNYSSTISPSGSVPSSITVSWSSNGPANVTLTPAEPCPGPSGWCSHGSPILAWTLVSSGKETTTATNSSAYILEVVNGGTVVLKFSAGVTVAYQPASPVPLWGWWLIAGGGIVLLGIGGIAIFLGLFLPGGVYSRGPTSSSGRVPSDYVPPDGVDGPDDRPR